MYIVYVFLDPNNVPYYVGKTSNFRKRERRHLSLIRNVRGRSQYPYYRKARKLIAKGFPFTMVPLKENLSEKEANHYERKFIKGYKSQGIKLYNMTTGGEGITDIGRILLGQKMKGKRTGYHHSAATRKLMSQRRMGMKFTEEHKKNLSKAWENRPPMTKKSRMKQSKTAKGNVNIKKYCLIDPQGGIHITTNGLTLFCEQNDLISANLHKVANGDREHHKGWKMKRI